MTSELEEFLLRLGKTDPDILRWIRSLLEERDALRALHRSDRLADLEALREVTEQLVVAVDAWERHYLTEQAETILRRLREDKPAPSLRDIEEGRATSLREAT